MLDSHTINNLPQFYELKLDWESLRTRNPKYGFCLSWHWLYQWCENFLKEKDTLFIQVFYHQGKLVAIIPTYLKKLPVGYELRFIGTGEAERAEVCSEFQDFIITKHYAKQIRAQFLDMVLESDQIKSIEFNNVLADFESVKFLRTLKSSPWRLNKASVGQRFIGNIYDNQTQQLSQISGRSNRRKLRKVIDSNAFVVHQVKHLNEFDIMFQQLVELHQSAWQQRGKIGAFTQPEFINFHINYAKNLLKNNQLLMFSLSLDDEVVAVFYGIIDAKCLSYYQSGIQVNHGFDGLGVAMHFKAMDYARERGLLSYDLMRGAKNSYKKQITPATSEIYSHTLIRKELLSGIINKMIAGLKLKVNQLSSIYGL